MPQVIVAAAGSALIAGITSGFTVAVLGQAFLGSLILGGLSHALTPKPKKPGVVNEINSSTFTVRQPDSTRKHCYGLTRFTDCYAQIVSTGVNGKIHAIVVICDDEIESMDEVWVNDYPISPDHMDGDGNVISGRYNGKLRIRKHLGSPTQVADSVAVAEIPEWTTDHRLQGISYLYVTLTKDQDVYPNGMPNFSVIGKMKKLLDPRDGITRWSPNVMLFIYDYLSQAEYGYLADHEDLNITNINAQANICDEIVDTVDLDTSVASAAPSTDILTLTGDRLMYEIGDRVEMVLSGSSPASSLPSGLSAGTDYYVIPYQFKDTPRIKLAASLADAIAGIAVNFTNAGTGSFLVRKTGEPRYHGAGVVDTADTLEDNLNAMLTSIAGRAVCIGGAWTIYAGAWRTPTVEFVIGDLRADLKSKPKISVSDKYNTINGLFVSQINDWQKADYPGYRFQGYIDADLEEYPKNLPNQYSTRPTTCKRIAKLEVLRARLERIFSSTFSMKAFQVQAGDNVMMTIDRRGWEQKPFEITQFGFNVSGDGDNIQLLIDMTMRETLEDIYEWAASEDDPPLVLAPNTNLPDAYTVPGVTGLSFSSRLIGSQGGDVVYALVLAWGAHPDAFVVNYGNFELQQKLSSLPDDDEYWSPSFPVDGRLTSSDVLVSSVNTQYDIRIRAVNNLGVRSAWTTIENATVGSTGGVGATNDWGFVYDSPVAFNDWDSVASSPSAFLDWGTVT